MLASRSRGIGSANFRKKCADLDLKFPKFLPIDGSPD
jgi:hypothetical protein